MPDVALIPPHSQLDDLHGRKLQMLLPSSLRAHAQHYAGMNNDTHIILDNGMFEDGKPVSTKELLGLAMAFKANEIVLPDVRDDSQETCKLVRRFLTDYEADNLGAENISFMAVVQGATHAERCQTVKTLSRMVPEGTVLGFPRRLTQEKHRARLDIMEYVTEVYGAQFKLHMLGLSREWPEEFLRATRQFGPLLRGLDTSAPYIFAYYGSEIPTLWSVNGERPSDFFDLRADLFPQELVDYNIYTLESWAQGLFAPSFQYWKETNGLS